MEPITKKSLRRLDLGGKTPVCPLCHKKMERKWEPARGFYIFACDTDFIAIRVDDPFVGKWDAAYAKTEPILCPNPRCSEVVMRYFATSTGYMKAKCPKCGATIANAEPDRDKTTYHASPEKPGALQ